MEKLSGFITSEIKNISCSPLLFWFQLTDRNDNRYNRLIHMHALNFFQQAKKGSAIEVLAKKNKRGQYVVKRYNVFNAEVVV